MSVPPSTSEGHAVGQQPMLCTAAATPRSSLRAGGVRSSSSRRPRRSKVGMLAAGVAPPCQRLPTHCRRPLRPPGWSYYDAMLRPHADMVKALKAKAGTWRMTVGGAATSQAVLRLPARCALCTRATAAASHIPKHHLPIVAAAAGRRAPVDADALPPGVHQHHERPEEAGAG